MQVGRSPRGSRKFHVQATKDRSAPIRLTCRQTVAVRFSPQVGFSAAILRINPGRSLGSRGRQAVADTMNGLCLARRGS
jgi:hypothetical protein